MAIKIAIVNAKGGVGKTTVSVNIADGLRVAGGRVLLIDSDPQGSTTSCYTGSTIATAGANLINLLRGDIPAEECITKTSRGDIITADQGMEECMSEFDIMPEGSGYCRLKEGLRDIEQNYDFIVMDTPPDFYAFTKNVLYAADGCIIPVHLEKFSFDGLGKILNKIDAVRNEGNKDLKIFGVLINNFDKDHARARSMVDNKKELEDALGLNVFNTVIRKSNQIKNAIEDNRNLFLNYGNSIGAKDFATFIMELLVVIGYGKK